MKAKMALLIAATILLMLSTQGCAPSPRWGYLANSGSPVPIKGTYFFTGDAWPGQPSYTFTPLNKQHLNWETGKDYTPAFVVDAMASVGINVVVMSYWGPDQIHSAPMNSTQEAGDLLFFAAIDRHISIIPSVEVASGLPNHYAQDDFVKARLLNLIHRYLMPKPNGEHPNSGRWPSLWAK